MTPNGHQKQNSIYISLHPGHTIPMKRQNTLPDFTELCPPEQNHTAQFISLQIFFFFLCSIAGFLWEVAIFFVKDGGFTNRGFLYGPWLPVYGVGGVLFYILLSGIAKKHPVRAFALSLLIGTGLELLIGWFLDSVWDLRYWDYRSYPLNYKGYICLYSALGFGIAGVLWVCVLSGFFAKLWKKLPGRVRLGANTILVLLFALDCAAALIFPNIGQGITFP